MPSGEPKYSLDGLNHGIERCRVNIVSLKTAIANERATIATYEKHKRDLVFAKSAQEEALANVHIELIN